MTKIPLSFQNLIPELLAEIFMQCVLEDAKEDNPWPLTHLAPLKLGRVCSYWRSVSLSSPKLWTIINFTVEHDLPGHLATGADSNESQLADAAQIFMDRARNLPVSYTVVSDFYLDAFPDIGEQLRHNIHRLKELHLDIGMDVALLSDWLPEICCEAPLIQSLILHNGSNIENQECSIGSMPNLSRLELMGDPTTFALQEPLPLLRQLVLIHYAYAGDEIEWLKRCPALEILFISFSPTSWGQPLMDVDGSEDEPCELRRLSKLTLECEDHDNYLRAQAFFNHLTAPALRDLSFDSQTSPAEPPLFEEFAAPFMRFLDRSAPLLKALSISIPWLDSFITLEILYKTYSIQSLDLTKVHVVDISTILECMTNLKGQSNSNGHDCWPSLRRLVVSQDQRTLPALREMVSSRCNERANTLKELIILIRGDKTGSPDPVFQSDPCLLECISHGLKLEFRTWKQYYDERQTEPFERFRDRITPLNYTF